MTLAHGWVLNFLWILPLAGFALFFGHRRRQKALQQFAEPALLTRLTAGDHTGRRRLKDVLLLGGLALLLLALAGPRWGQQYQEVSRKGVDIMVLVDVSRSMMVQDVKPSRLERARREIVDFLKVVEGDRVGLTAFAGAAFVQCPLTLDYAALKMFLTALAPGVIPVPGTDLGEAIRTTMTAFDFERATDKVMVLITDGEDNEGGGLAAAAEAARQNVKIFIFGIGEPSGGPVPADPVQGGFAEDPNGKLVLSRLDEVGLQTIATQTEGGYVRAVSGDLDLDMLYFEGIKQKTQAKTVNSGKIKIYEERFTFFILAASLFILLEGLLDRHHRPRSSKKINIFKKGLNIGCLGLLLYPHFALGADSPDELYRKGRYEAAQKAYTKGDMDHPKDIRFRYNRGCAAYQNRQYRQAAAAFASVLRRAKDRQIRFKAAYNLGNTAFKQAEYAKAVAHFKQAITANPASQDAKYNLELALRAQKKMEEQQHAPPQGSSGTENAPNESKKPDYPRQTKKQADAPKNPVSQKPEARPAENEKQNNRQDEDRQANQATNAGNSASGQEQQQSQNTATQSPAEKIEPGADLPGQNRAAENTKDDPSAADRNRAEALLDNVEENPSGIMRFMMGGRTSGAAPSGKDW
jgi:Ca-activated chloride channel family protein